MKKNGLFAIGLIWFGAATSLAEIEAGCRMGRNWPALVLGHLIGGALLFAMGLIGARARLNAMETTRATFGLPGSRLFAALNLLQLVGWASVMIAQGAVAMSELSGVAARLWCVPLAALVAGWLFVALGGAPRLAALCTGLLALLCALLTVRLIGAPPPADAAPPVSALGFGPAFEISVALPLSWLPLVSDYTKDADRPVAASAVAASAYSLVGVWMFALGFLLVGAGCPDLARCVARMGRGFAPVGLVVIALSTTMTTFLDAYSSGESLRSILPRANPRAVGLAVCAIGCVCALLGIMERYIGFLCLVASVFAPMAAVLLVDRYLVRRGLARWNLLAWFAGFLAYRFAGDLAPCPTLVSLLAAGGLAALGLLPVFGNHASGTSHE